ncbi:MAG: hypothetical protein RL518_199 [Pseudomonadota bacterium]|jgi:hypothetical protein
MKVGLVSHCGEQKTPLTHWNTERYDVEVSVLTGSTWQTHSLFRG